MSRDTSVSIISGRLTRDPEIKTTQSGKSVCSFSIACNDDKEKVNFFDCQAWEKTAEIINQYCKKGNKILVTGRFNQQRWDDDNGVKRSKYVLNVQAFEFMGGKNEQSQSDKSGADKVNEGFNGTTTGPENFDDDVPW